MRLNRICLGLALCFVFSQASAQFTISSDYLGTKDADIDGQNASLSTHSYGLKANYNFVSFQARRTTYDFSNVESDPFDELTKLQLSFYHKGQITSNISYLGNLGLGILYEDNFDVSKSYAVTPSLAIGWDFSNGMTAFFGASANLNAADNVYLPVIGLQLGNEKEQGWTGAIAYPATRVQYRFNPQLAVNATFLTIRDTYHLDDEADKGSWADGYFREESYGTSVGAIFSPIKHLQLSAGIVSFFNRQFKVYDQNGNKIESFDTDPALGGYANISYSF